MPTRSSEHVADDVPKHNNLIKGRFSKRMAFFATVVFFLGIGIAYWLFSPWIEHFISSLENSYITRIQPHLSQLPVWLLLPVAFIGGVIASVSPCIISLLPLNLSYIGTLDVQSKPKALLNAVEFVLGTVLILSLLGLISSFAGALLIDYKGYVNLAVGLFVFLMGLSFWGVIKLPLPQLIKRLPGGRNPFFMGLIFALISSPCASPVLLTMLTVAGSSGNPWMSMMTMASYALGYTLILFIASLLVGVAKQAHQLKSYASTIVHLGGFFLIIIGSYYLWKGLSWFVHPTS